MTAMLHGPTRNAALSLVGALIFAATVLPGLGPSTGGGAQGSVHLAVSRTGPPSPATGRR